MCLPLARPIRDPTHQHRMEDRVKTLSKGLLELRSVGSVGGGRGVSGKRRPPAGVMRAPQLSLALSSAAASAREHSGACRMHQVAGAKQAVTQASRRGCCSRLSLPRRVASAVRALQVFACVDLQPGQLLLREQPAITLPHDKADKVRREPSRAVRFATRATPARSSARPAGPCLVHTCMSA